MNRQIAGPLAEARRQELIADAAHHRHTRIDRTHTPGCTNGARRRPFAALRAWVDANQL